MKASLEVHKQPRPNGLFDPMSELFVAQFARPVGLEPVNLRALTPFQRALLVIDGTVTKFIEAYTLEPVEVVRLSQVHRSLSIDHSWLEARAGTEVIARQVILRGEYSHTFYAYAVSLIVQERLPEQMKQNFEEEEGGIGRILLHWGAETRRDILWYGKERIDELPEDIQRISDGEFISRTYRIVAGGTPVMLINERFPFYSVRFPSHH